MKYKRTVNIKRLLLLTIPFLVTLASHESMSNASDNFTFGFDIPPRAPQSLFGNIETKNLRQPDSTEGDSLKSKSIPRAPSSREEIAKMNLEKAERIAERRRKAREKIRQLRPDPADLHRMSKDELLNAKGAAIENDPGLDKEENQWIRRLWNFGSDTTNFNAYSDGSFADASVSYDSWQQGYRMIGAFIDCDAAGDGGGDDGGSGDNQNQNGSECSRWMMWAAYVNPNYAGGGRDEYFAYNDDAYYDEEGEEATPVSKLDCHSPDTEWELLGVYRQEFYQFLEQISKHLWAIDDYEYVVALAGLAYMTDANCFKVGYDSNGNNLYAGVEPMSGGQFMMSLYNDYECLNVNTDSGLTYDSFGLTSDMYLGSEDDGCLDDDALYTLYSYWTSAQEYTLTLMNEIYDEYKYCTLCMDYPTYQDGYFIGDTGTDEDDMINQCWKFHSHDSYPCTAECVSMGDQQGTIVQVAYGSNQFGSSWDGSSSSGSSKTFDHLNKGYQGDHSEQVQKFKANMFLTFNGILFIATFLAFSVARGSRADSRPSDRKKSLLSNNERSKADKSKASRSRKARRKSSGDESRTTRSRESRRAKSTQKTRPKSNDAATGRKSKSRGRTPQKERDLTKTRKTELIALGQ